MLRDAIMSLCRYFLHLLHITVLQKFENVLSSVHTAPRVTRHTTASVRARFQSPTNDDDSGNPRGACEKFLT